MAVIEYDLRMVVGRGRGTQKGKIRVEGSYELVDVLTKNLRELFKALDIYTR